MVFRFATIPFLAMLIFLAVPVPAADGFPDEYGLYVTSSDTRWADPCKLKYEIAGFGSSHVSNKRYVLIRKSRDLDFLDRLKRKYSTDGLDQPDGKVKLRSCRKTIVVESPADTPRAQRASYESSNPGYYVNVELEFIPRGSSPARVSVTDVQGTTYVRRKRLRCQVGPMTEDAAKRVRLKLERNSSLITGVLGRHAHTTLNGFIYRNDSCVIKYR